MGIGGDKSLIMSMELPEDDPHTGAKELEETAKDKKQVLHIGITCGVSAPYVLGQVEYAMKRSEKFTSVLMGFNPMEFARSVPVEKWDKTCRDVAMELWGYTQKKTVNYNSIFFGWN